LPASSIDIAPTLLAAAGLPPTADMPGLNLLDRKALDRRKAIFGETFTHNAVDINHPASSLRDRWTITENWKLILPDPRNSPQDHPALYDIIADPFERHDLSKRHPKKVVELKGLIDSWWNPEANPAETRLQTTTP
jgi:uncharacterized sulfatase